MDYLYFNSSTSTFIRGDVLEYVEMYVRALFRRTPLIGTYVIQLIKNVFRLYENVMIYLFTIIKGRDSGIGVRLL